MTHCLLLLPVIGTSLRPAFGRSAFGTRFAQLEWREAVRRGDYELEGENFRCRWSGAVCADDEERRRRPGGVRAGERERFRRRGGEARDFREGE